MNGADNYKSIQNVLDIYKIINRKKVQCHFADIKVVMLKTCDSINSVLDKLSLQLHNSKSNRNKELRDNIRAELTNIETLFENIDETFSIFIMGSGKFGKSTLLNALIGKQTVKVDVLPKTWKIDIFKKDDNVRTAKIRYKDGRLIQMTKEKTIEIVEKEESRAEEAIKKAQEIYKTESKKYKDRKELLELKAEIEKKCFYRSDIVEIIWSCEGKGLLNNFQLVDTPGLNQELLDGTLKPAFNDYYNKADGILWLLDATKISAKAAYETIDNSKQKTDINVIGVINKIDEIGEIDSSNVTTLLNKAKEIYGEKFPTIVPISALKAYNGLINKDMEAVERSGYTRLVKEINDLFLKKGLEIRYKRKLEGLKEYTLMIRRHINTFLMQLNKDMKRYNELKRNFYNSLNRLNDSISQCIENEFNSYNDKVMNNIYTRADKIFDLDNSDKSLIDSYVKEAIFAEDEFNNIIVEIMNKVQEECTDSFDYWKTNSCIKEYEYIDSFEYNENYSLAKVDDDSEDEYLNISFGGTDFLTGIAITTFLAVLLGPAGLIVAYFAGKTGFIEFAAKKVAKVFYSGKVKREFIHTLEKMVDEVKTQLNEKANSMMERLKTSIDDIRDNSFSELYYDYKDMDDIKRLLSQLDAIDIIQLPEIKLNDILKGEKNGYKQAN